MKGKTCYNDVILFPCPHPDEILTGVKSSKMDHTTRLCLICYRYQKIKHTKPPNFPMFAFNFTVIKSFQSIIRYDLVEQTRCATCPP